MTGKQDPGLRANLIGLVCNFLLAIAKFIVGYLAASEALLADGFNSAGDVFATAIAYIGYRYARKPPDDDHHYGHGNAESVAGLIIGGLLLATGVFITLDGLFALVRGKDAPPDSPAIWVAVITILVKEALYQYTVLVGKRLNSPSLLASARDHRADVLVAATVVVGILGARSGYYFLDPTAALVVGIYIAWMAVEPILGNVATLMDKAPPEVGIAVRAIAREVEEVRGVERVRVHPLGSYFMINLAICLDRHLDLEKAHLIAHRVADLIRERIDHVEDVEVYVRPAERR